jgi:class 3 adenylate cyclase
MQRSLIELNCENEGTGKPALDARVAIDVHPLVVEPTGETFGDVPNVAALAQALPEPGSVLVSASSLAGLAPP